LINGILSLEINYGPNSWALVHENWWALAFKEFPDGLSIWAGFWFGPKRLCNWKNKNGALNGLGWRDLVTSKGPNEDGQIIPGQLPLWLFLFYIFVLIFVLWVIIWLDLRRMYISKLYQDFGRKLSKMDV
jgi:TM2 domain-containing membrane protein YozV